MVGGNECSIFEAILEKEEPRPDRRISAVKRQESLFPAIKPQKRKRKQFPTTVSETQNEECRKQKSEGLKGRGPQGPRGDGMDFGADTYSAAVHLPRPVADRRCGSSFLL